MVNPTGVTQICRYDSSFKGYRTLSSEKTLNYTQNSPRQTPSGSLSSNIYLSESCTSSTNHFSILNYTSTEITRVRNPTSDAMSISLAYVHPPRCSRPCFSSFSCQSARGRRDTLSNDFPRGESRRMAYADTPRFGFGLRANSSYSRSLYQSRGLPDHSSPWV